MSSRKSFDNEAQRAIGSRIREARGSLNQAAFAQLIDVDRATLSNYETGRRLPNTDTLHRIHEFSGYTPEYILHGKVDDFDLVRDAFDSAQKRWQKLSSSTPGYFPKWFFSEFEVAFIRCLRSLDEADLTEITSNLYKAALKQTESVERDFDVTSFLREPLEHVYDALEKRSFPRGEDLEETFWALGRVLNRNG